MNKKWFAIGLVLLLGVVILLTACGGGNQSASNPGSGSSTNETETPSKPDGKVYDLNFNIATGPTHPFITELSEPWAEYVNEKTDGRVNIHLFPNVALGPLTKAYDDLSGGVYDFGMVIGGYLIDTPLYPMSIADLPFAIPNSHVATEVMTKFKEKYMNDVFGKGVTFLSTSSTDPYQLVSKKPVESLEDIKHMKINSSLPGVIEVLKQLEAVPVSQPNTEIYEGIQRGIVDGAIYTGTGSVSFKFYEVAPYMTMLDVATASQTLGMSTSTFESLPEDIQTMFLEDFGPRFAEKMAEMYDNLLENDGPNQYVQEAENGRLIELSGAELDGFRASAEPYWNSWVEEANKRGYPGDEMMADFKNWLKEAGAEVKF